MSKKQIDRIKLAAMLRKGKSQKVCAEFFSVTESAICQAKKEMNISVVKNIVLENAARVVDKHLNTVEQLQKINNHTNELLDLLTRWTNGDKEAEKLLLKQSLSLNIRFQDPRDLALKAIAEIRNQLKLQLEIFQSLYDMKAVQEFQAEVLETIGQVNKEVRDEIIRRLSEKSAIRRTISFN